MSEWVAVLMATAAVFLVVGLGAGLRLSGWLTAEADASLLKLVVRVLFPALIVQSIVGNPALGEAVNVWLPPMIGFGTVAASTAVAGAVAWWAGPWLGLRSPAARRTFAVAVGLHNYGYLPIPLATSLYGAESGVLGVLFVNNVGVDLAMWTIGVAVMGGALGWSGLRNVVNGPSIAVVGSLVLHFLGAEALPEPIDSATAMLAACAVPIALLLVGATLVEAFGGMRDGARSGDDAGRPSGIVRGHAVMLAVACGLRLGLLPLGFVTLAWALPQVMSGAMPGGVPGEVPGDVPGAGAGDMAQIQRVLLLHAAMPAAVFPVVLARHYGGDPATAARVAVGTSLVSLVTMPAWLAGTAGVVG